MDKAKLDELRNRAQDWCYDESGYGKIGIALWPDEHAALFAYIDGLTDVLILARVWAEYDYAWRAVVERIDDVIEPSPTASTIHPRS